MPSKTKRKVKASTTRKPTKATRDNKRISIPDRLEAQARRKKKK